MAQVISKAQENVSAEMRQLQSEIIKMKGNIKRKTIETLSRIHATEEKIKKL